MNSKLYVQHAIARTELADIVTLHIICLYRPTVKINSRFTACN